MRRAMHGDEAIYPLSGEEYHAAVKGAHVMYRERLVLGEGERVEVMIGGEHCGRIEVASLLPPPTEEAVADVAL